MHRGKSPPRSGRQRENTAAALGPRDSPLHALSRDAAPWLSAAPTASPSHVTRPLAASATPSAGDTPATPP